MTQIIPAPCNRCVPYREVAHETVHYREVAHETVHYRDVGFNNLVPTGHTHHYQCRVIP